MGISEEDRNSIVKYRIERSRQMMVEAEDVLKLGHLALCANRLYYTIFHMASALLISNGHLIHTHAGIQRMINLYFVKENKLSRDDSKLINRLFSMRQQGDYGDVFDYEREEIINALESTKLLLNKIESLI